ncbi:ribosome-associated protein [Labedella gwakjiensis]|uniref:RNA-binding S4 domain-containing protein n=1 Tax=Labedella gwakjiensis TaxID=390269 RepID=A0A2P8GRN6_9MICO|nr:RNA-binding S4 domain-containing protein [Labedella gwakjiensis]PSL36628.1 ribosome-associated protein [Labedella gwakjiensis]RUQ84152.1 RNA-binding S4 domain-containing protein [Labedella gwakjiensis]
MRNPGPVDDVSIGSDVIRLGQFLKFSGLLDSGGDAKAVIADGEVRVNGEREFRRGRQLVDGDLVTFGGRSVRVRP